MKILPLLMVIVANIPENDGAGYPSKYLQVFLKFPN